MSVLKTYAAQSGYVPSRTWKIDGDHAQGVIDGLDAVRQAIDLIIETQRYAWEIYSTDYGIELSDLIGKHRDYVEGDMERRITDALMEDDRIIGVHNFSIAFERENANIKVIAETKFGTVPIERSVPIG